VTSTARARFGSIDWRATREKWESVYVEAVEALAGGGDCDCVFLTDLLAALGKTTDDLAADIEAMSKTLAIAAIHDGCVRAKLNSLGERRLNF
jgi:hypothetical protein